MTLEMLSFFDADGAHGDHLVVGDALFVEDGQDTLGAGGGRDTIDFESHDGGVLGWRLKNSKEFS